MIWEIKRGLQQEEKKLEEVEEKIGEGKRREEGTGGDGRGGEGRGRKGKVRKEEEKKI